MLLLDVENPATEQVIAQISLGSQVDVDHAVAAARAAFDSFSETTPAERIALLERIIAEFNRRAPELATTMTAEMGAPTWLARDAQVPLCAAHSSRAPSWTTARTTGCTRGWMPPSPGTSSPSRWW